MDKVQAHPDAAPAICPICGAWPASSSARIDGSVAIGDYRDALGHIWTTKWLVPA